MAEKSPELIGSKELTCFEGLKLLEKLLISGQFIPASEIESFLREAEYLEFVKALLVARLMDLENAFQFLHEAGAHILFFDDDYDPIGERLLKEAVEINCPQRISCLLTLHKTLRLFIQHDIMLAARLAAERGNVECLRLLVNVRSFKRRLRNIRSITITDVDNDRDNMSARKRDEALLYLAASNGKVECVRLLLKLGFHVDGKRWCPATPLFVACQQGHLDVVKILLEAGADRNKPANDGRKLLPATLSAGSLDCARELIKLGVNVNSRGNDRRTPLHIAASDGLTDIATKLIERGADLEAKDLDGCTPLFFAVRRAEEAMVRLLVAAGADINAKSKDGKSVQELVQSDKILALLRV